MSSDESDGDGRARETTDGSATDSATETVSVEDWQVDALRALGNERRLEILFALAARERATRTNQQELSFTELYDAVDVDSTSQFSYHLSQLVGSFVTATDDGYHLSYSGDRVVRAVESGVYESTTAFDPVAVDGACLVCGERALEAVLRDERFVVRCRDCERTLLSDSFPQSQASDRTASEIVESFGYRIWSTYVLVRGDVCPECYGRLDRRVDVHDDVERYTFASRCDGCGFTIHLPLEVPPLFHPPTVAFLWRHGVSLLDLPLWEAFALFASGNWTTDVRSVTPLEASFRLEMDGETLALAMDDRFTVTAAAGDGGTD